MSSYTTHDSTIVINKLREDYGDPDLRTPFEVSRSNVESVEELKGRHWPAFVALGVLVTILALVLTFGAGYPSD